MDALQLVGVGLQVVEFALLIDVPDVLVGPGSDGLVGGWTAEPRLEHGQQDG